jgi:hypothetical protein
MVVNYLPIFIVLRPEQFVVEGRKENDYLGMPEAEDEYEEYDEETLKVDSMGNTIEDDEDADS